jgi:hypothetical protein
MQTVLNYVLFCLSFLLSYDLAPRPPPSSLSRHQAASLSKSSFVSPVISYVLPTQSLHMSRKLKIHNWGFIFNTNRKKLPIAIHLNL